MIPWILPALTDVIEIECFLRDPKANAPRLISHNLVLIWYFIGGMGSVAVVGSFEEARVLATQERQMT